MTSAINASIGNGYRREGYVTYKLSTNLCNQRNSQSIGTLNCFVLDILHFLVDTLMPKCRDTYMLAYRQKVSTTFGAI